MLSNVGPIHNRDALRRRRLPALPGRYHDTIVFGLGMTYIHIWRTRDVRINIGKVMQDAFGADKGGGHSMLAGAQITAWSTGGKRTSRHS